MQLGAITGCPSHHASPTPVLYLINFQVAKALNRTEQIKRFDTKKKKFCIICDFKIFYFFIFLK